MRGGINIRTAEILTGTKTFQKAKTCIYNTDGMPVYVDIPTEYGKNMVEGSGHRKCILFWSCSGQKVEQDKNKENHTKSTVQNINM